jgi:hypothetical protein
MLTAFINHMDSYQAQPIPYRWKEHIAKERRESCDARMPVPYSGKEGFTWPYGGHTEPLCSDHSFQRWSTESGNEVFKNNKNVIFNTANEKSRPENAAITEYFSEFQVDDVPVFVNFGGMIFTEAGSQPVIGIRFLDKNRRPIKDLSDQITQPALTFVYVALAPENTHIIAPYVRLNADSEVRLSKPTLIVLSD